MHGVSALSCTYCIGSIFHGEKILQILRFRKIIHRKQKIYMVHIIFLTNSQNFNPAKYTVCLCDFNPKF